MFLGEWSEVFEVSDSFCLFCVMCQECWMFLRDLGVSERRQKYFRFLGVFVFLRQWSGVRDGSDCVCVSASLVMWIWGF